MTGTNTAEQLVYPRDHSVYWARPGTTHGASKYHWPHPAENGTSACGRSVIDNTLDPHTREPATGRRAATIPELLRCRSTGCAQRWATFTAPGTSR